MGGGKKKPEGEEEPRTKKAGDFRQGNVPNGLHDVSSDKVHLKVSQALSGEVVWEADLSKRTTIRVVKKLLPRELELGSPNRMSAVSSVDVTILSDNMRIGKLDPMRIGRKTNS